MNVQDLPDAQEKITKTTDNILGVVFSTIDNILESEEDVLTKSTLNTSLSSISGNLYKDFLTFYNSFEKQPYQSKSRRWKNAINNRLYITQLLSGRYENMDNQDGIVDVLTAYVLWFNSLSKNERGNILEREVDIKTDKPKPKKDIKFRKPKTGKYGRVIFTEELEELTPQIKIVIDNILKENDDVKYKMDVDKLKKIYEARASKPLNINKSVLKDYLFEVLSNERIPTKYRTDKLTKTEKRLIDQFVESTDLDPDQITYNTIYKYMLDKGVILRANSGVVAKYNTKLLERKFGEEFKVTKEHKKKAPKRKRKQNIEVEDDNEKKYKEEYLLWLKEKVGSILYISSIIGDDLEVVEYIINDIYKCDISKYDDFKSEALYTEEYDDILDQVPDPNKDYFMKFLMMYGGIIASAKNEYPNIDELKKLAKKNFQNSVKCKTIYKENDKDCIIQSLMNARKIIHKYDPNEDHYREFVDAAKMIAGTIINKDGSVYNVAASVEGKISLMYGLLDTNEKKEIFLKENNSEKITKLLKTHKIKKCEKCTIAILLIYGQLKFYFGKDNRVNDRIFLFASM